MTCSFVYMVPWIVVYTVQVAKYKGIEAIK